MILDPASTFRDLVTRAPVRLDALPREGGIYALHDHIGAIRYIGVTELGFRDRIYRRHVTGSESRSHKFSHAYNTGRMWRAKDDFSSDAKVARALRAAFVRQYCRATYVAVSSARLVELVELEKAVQAMASQEMLDWGERRSFVSLAEPAGLVDKLLLKLGYRPDECAAVERQAALHAAIFRF
jgi:hypothetical protein